MNLSLRQLEQAVSVRRQIDALERRFAVLVGFGLATRSAAAKTGGGSGRRRRTMSAATRAKIAAAARARWARVRGGRKAKRIVKKAIRRGRMSTAARKKLSDMMKARWAARRRSGK